MAECQSTKMLNVTASSRASPLPQVVGVHPGEHWLVAMTPSRKPCGSWLASDEGVSVNKDAECDGLIAGKPAPTVLLFLDQPCGLRINTANGGRFSSSDND